jgi:hypothetical protein
MIQIIGSLVMGSFACALFVATVSLGRPSDRPVRAGAPPTGR